MKIFTLILLCILFTGSASGQWVYTGGPGGGDVSRIYDYFGKLEATTSNGIYISSDNAAHWKATGTGENLNNLVVNGTSVLGSTNFKIMRSEDSMATWKTVFDFETDNSQDTFIVDFESKGKIIVLSYFFYTGTPTNYFITRSTDNGATWKASPINDSAGATTSIFSIGQYLFASAVRTGLFRSADTGLTWQKLPVTSDTLKINFVTSMRDTIYLVTPDRFYYSIDSGSTWASNTNVDIPNFENARRIGKFGNTIFLGLNSGELYSSDDMGKKWTRCISNGLPANMSTNSLSQSLVSDGFYLTNRSGIYKSIDGGLTWQTRNSGLLPKRTNFAYSQGDSLIIGAASNLYTTTDHGTSWDQMTKPAELSNIVVDHTVEYGADRWFWSGYQIWHAHNGAMDLVSTDTSGAIIAGILPTEIFRLSGSDFSVSTDGISWNAVHPQIGNWTGSFYISEIIPLNGVLYMIGTNSNYDEFVIARRVSDDLWDVVYSASNISYSVSPAMIGSTLYLGGDATGLLRSDDNGLTWAVDPDFPPNLSIGALHAWKNTLFCAAAEPTVNGSDIYYRNINSGAFQSFGKGMPSITWLQVHSDGNLYAGANYNNTKDDGIWKRPLSELGVSETMTDAATEIITPNPAKDHITIDEDASITLFSTTGVEVFYGQAVKGESIALPKLASGVYIAKIATSGGMKMAKVVIE